MCGNLDKGLLDLMSFSSLDHGSKLCPLPIIEPRVASKALQKPNPENNMEAMDIFLATTKEISYLIMNHPFYSAIGGIICFVSLLTFYCRLTLGICDCDIDLIGKTVLITGASAGSTHNTKPPPTKQFPQTDDFTKGMASGLRRAAQMAPFAMVPDKSNENHGIMISDKSHFYLSNDNRLAHVGR
ncbi:uncharacterized protein TNCV_1722161 [Trichonephila clavipes]|nr:uncharacterized protein TNCV_1722161 [Trichonephila clavipes]